MLPINNGETSPCSNISSNCVVWQGPDIPCIGLCHGDTISDVIAKLAEQLCDLTDGIVAAEPDLSGLNLLCVLPSGQTAPDTVSDTMQLIIDYVCDINQSSTSLPIVSLPNCLHYDDPAGNAVLALPLDDYAALVANKVCDILTSIEIIDNTILDHESRLVVLENCVLPCSASSPSDVQVISSCILSGQGLVNLSALVLALETRYCNLESNVGSTAIISNAINSQCLSGSDAKLSGQGNYSGESNWINTPSTLSHVVQNLWVVVCDMYSAIEDIQLNCCPGACDSIVYGFTTTLNQDGNGIPTNIVVDFTSSSIPSSYNDCSGGSSITITDSNGLTKSTTVNTASLQNQPSGVTLSLTGLFLFGGFSIETDFCVTDGANTCRETVTKTLNSAVPCPKQMTQTADETTITVTFSQYLGTSATYTITAKETGTTTVVASNVVTNPGLSVSSVLTGLTASTEYTVEVLVSIGGESVLCDFSETITTDDETQNYTLRNCTGTGDTFVGSYSSGTLTIGQSVFITTDGGANCWEVIGTTGLASTTTITAVYADCTTCNNSCRSWRITSSDANNDGDVIYVDCTTGQTTSEPVVGVVTFTICSTVQPVFGSVSGPGTIVQIGSCS